MLNRLVNLVRPAAIGSFLILLSGFTPPACAQNPALQDVPRIEGTYTQILSTDTMGIGMAALSPDGRWIVFTGHLGLDDSRLWIVPTAGGDPFPITSGPAYGDGPVWFPGGDRIAFRSGDHIASLSIDPSTGRPAGDPQRVTLDPSSAYFDVSPDGQWIAYTPQDDHGNRVIRIVPSNGGIARTVTEANTSRPAWAPDGKSIYYAAGRIDSPERVLMRVRVEAGGRAEGAEPEEVFSHVGSIGTCTYPGTAFVWLGGFGTPEKPGVVITTLEGQPLGLLELEKEMRPRTFSSDGSTLLVESHGSASPLRVLPVSGGAPRTLQRNDSRALSWTADGEGVLMENTLDGTRRLFLAAAFGGVMTELRLPEQRADFGEAAMDFPLEHQPDPVLSGDGRHLLYAVPGTAPDTATLKILDMETNAATTLTNAYPVPGRFMVGRVLGPGGIVNRDEDEFFFWEKSAADLVLKAAKPTGESRILRAFSDPEESVSVAVWGDKITFVKHENGEASVLISKAGSQESEAILTVDGFLDVLSWSPDGRWLAATHWPGDGAGAKAMLIEVSSDRTVKGEPRSLGPSASSWWGHQWLPDSSGFLTAGTEGDVWFMPVDPMTDPVPITEAEEGAISSFVLSPDGTNIAYAPWIPEGHSVWLIDLGDALIRTSR